eukprot:36485-Pleurochrysis_carterae.AAC.1
MDYWIEHGKATYTKEQLQDAAAWLKRANEYAVRPAPATVGIGSLNAGQSYAYRSILEHHSN